MQNSNRNSSSSSIRDFGEGGKVIGVRQKYIQFYSIFFCNKVTSLWLYVLEAVLVNLLLFDISPVLPLSGCLLASFYFSFIHCYCCFCGFLKSGMTSSTQPNEIYSIFTCLAVLEFFSVTIIYLLVEVVIMRVLCCLELARSETRLKRNLFIHFFISIVLSLSYFVMWISARVLVSFLLQLFFSAKYFICMLKWAIITRLCMCVANPTQNYAQNSYLQAYFGFVHVFNWSTHK